MIEQGKLKTGMPSSFNIGVLSGLGMWTFFGIIGIVALVMGEAFAKSGIIHYIAIFIALLLIVLGSMMLLGITSHVMGFVQIWSINTARPRPTRRSRLAATCTSTELAIAAASLTVPPLPCCLRYLPQHPGTSAIGFGIAGLMVGLLILMIAVTMLVAHGTPSDDQLPAPSHRSHQDGRFVDDDHGRCWVDDLPDQC